ncbi:MAG: hypothetical protein INQ03_23675 [Candidatus Heimdallarchaeota archaeon]|nr:hypothetical protein [Candidatus Heimdallarchaeota archaeon]
MSYAAIINTLSRLYNKYIMICISLIIFFILIVVGFNPTELARNTSYIILVLWVLFVLISSIYSINGILVEMSFKKELYQHQKAGRPMQGVRGYTELMESISAAKNKSILVTIASILSLLIFILSISDVGLNAASVATMAITMAFITISAVFLVDYPEGSALEVGGLLSFYEPDSFPLILDNLINDVVLTYLDPITYMAIDDWTSNLSDLLVYEVESNADAISVLERAKEKIFLLAYLANSIPDTVDEEVVHSEISELIGIEKLDRFITGETTGISWEEIKEIVKIIEKESPEVFRLVDRLLINLMDNYAEFTEKELYFTVSAQTNQGSVSESAGLIAYFLNGTNDKKKKVHVMFKSDIDSVHPHEQKISIPLDNMDQIYPQVRPEFIADGEDILSLLSTILQVGDAIWFRFKPNGFGFKVVTIQAEEEVSGMVMGRSIEMKFTKSISWYVKTFAPKLSALGGIALPVVQSIFIG